jgi:multiple sugar transport system substrate-binding protein
MKKFLLVLFSVLALLSMVLAAQCGAPTAAPTEKPAAEQPSSAAPASSASSAAPASSEAAKSGGAKLVVAALSGIEDQGLKSVIPDWEKATGNTVEMVELPYANLQEKIFTDMQAGAGSYDVIFVDDPWFPFLAGGGYLTPLSKFNYQVDTDFVQRSLDVSSWPPPFGPRIPGTAADAKSELYALPLLGNVQLFWYRKDVIPTEPATIADLIADAKKYADPAKGVYGYVHRGAKGNPVVTNFNAWNWSYGGDIFDDQWKVIINGDKSVKALEDYISLLPLAPQGAANFNADEVGAAMLNGSSLMAIVWPAFNTQIDDPSKSKVSGKIAVIPFPKGEKQTSQLGNWLLAIPAASKNQEAAFDLIKFATSKENMRKATEIGAPPTRKSIFEDPELAKKYYWYPAHEKALGNATWRPRTPEWNKVEDILGTYLSKALAGDMKAKEALDAAQKEITDVMDRAGYYKK